MLKRPLLIIPPWINKFYILDLRPKNSFIRWAVEQGHTVFVVSWVNPDEKLAEKGFDDYMREGPYAALDAIETATGEKAVNVIGYCLGGTLLAATLAHMAAKKDTRIKSATFFTTMIDFEEAGELGVFIDEEQLQSLEEKMQKRGFLEGTEMATTFNMLRANDLIWSFVVSNYLLGQEPFPFDLLYWNDDSTRMPARMHSFYLRRMYQQNDLVKPGTIELDGVPIDLRKVKLPTYVLSTREDHIAPWKSTYRATQVYGGKVRFVLAASGHIAGVVNPPEAGKYSHWVGDELPRRPRHLVQGRDGAVRLLVAGLAALGGGAGQGDGAGARAGRWRAAAAGRCAGDLRAGAGAGLRPPCPAIRCGSVPLRSPRAISAPPPAGSARTPPVRCRPARSPAWRCGRRPPDGAARP